MPRLRYREEKREPVCCPQHKSSAGWSRDSPENFRVWNFPKVDAYLRRWVERAHQESHPWNESGKKHTQITEITSIFSSLNMTLNGVLHVINAFLTVPTHLTVINFDFLPWVCVCIHHLNVCKSLKSLSEGLKKAVITLTGFFNLQLSKSQLTEIR